MSRANRGTLFWGTVLVLLGLAFLLKNFNLLPASLMQWWPLLVLGGGIWLFGQGLAERRGGAFGTGQIAPGASVVAGTVLAALGGFWLLDNLGRMDERLFAPILLIALGVGLLLRSLLAERR